MQGCSRSKRMPMADLSCSRRGSGSELREPGSAALPSARSPDVYGRSTNQALKILPDRCSRQPQPDTHQRAAQNPHMLREPGVRRRGARCWPACRWTREMIARHADAPSSVRGWTEPSRSPTRKSWLDGRSSTSRSPRIRITAWSSAIRASSEGVPGDQPTLTGRMRAGRGGSTAESAPHLVVEDQDTALSRRRCRPVGIGMRVPNHNVL